MQVFPTLAHGNIRLQSCNPGEQRTRSNMRGKVSDVTDEQHSQIFWDPRRARGHPLNETHTAQTREPLGQFHCIDSHDASSRYLRSFQFKNWGHQKFQDRSKGFGQPGECSGLMCSVWQSSPTAFAEGMPQILEQTTKTKIDPAVKTHKFW